MRTNIYTHLKKLSCTRLRKSCQYYKCSSNCVSDLLYECQK
uniref:Uncharacterized protein n=1 Tax=Anguilla anguilla TaxID=7936 RepID=A0A0E9XVI3_ANGAN